MKKFLLCVVMLFSMVGLYACSENVESSNPIPTNSSSSGESSSSTSTEPVLTKLDSPNDIAYSLSKISWQVVENAETYQVVVDEKTFEVTTNEVSSTVLLEKLGATFSGFYEVSVIAQAENYISSDPFLKTICFQDATLETKVREVVEEVFRGTTLTTDQLITLMLEQNVSFKSITNFIPIMENPETSIPEVVLSILAYCATLQEDRTDLAEFAAEIILSYRNFNSLRPYKSEIVKSASTLLKLIRIGNLTSLEQITDFMDKIESGQITDDDVNALISAIQASYDEGIPTVNEINQLFTFGKIIVSVFVEGEENQTALNTLLDASKSYVLGMAELLTCVKNSIDKDMIDAVLAIESESILVKQILPVREILSAIFADFDPSNAENSYYKAITKIDEGYNAIVSTGFLESILGTDMFSEMEVSVMEVFTLGKEIIELPIAKKETLLLLIVTIENQGIDLTSENAKILLSSLFESLDDLGEYYVSEKPFQSILKYGIENLVSSLLEVDISSLQGELNYQIENKNYLQNQVIELENEIAILDPVQDWKRIDQLNGYISSLKAEIQAITEGINDLQAQIDAWEPTDFSPLAEKIYNGLEGLIKILSKVEFTIEDFTKLATSLVEVMEYMQDFTFNPSTFEIPACARKLIVDLCGIMGKFPIDMNGADETALVDIVYDILLDMGLELTKEDLAASIEMVLQQVEAISQIDYSQELSLEEKELLDEILWTIMNVINLNPYSRYISFASERFNIVYNACFYECTEEDSIYLDEKKREIYNLMDLIAAREIPYTSWYKSYEDIITEVTTRFSLVAMSTEEMEGILSYFNLLLDWVNENEFISTEGTEAEIQMYRKHLETLFGIRDGFYILSQSGASIISQLQELESAIRTDFPNSFQN